MDSSLVILDQKSCYNFFSFFKKEDISSCCERQTGETGETPCQNGRTPRAKTYSNDFLASRKEKGLLRCLEGNDKAQLNFKIEEIPFIKHSRIHMAQQLKA